ncbi:putative ABC transporter ATP-binding protein YxlF [Planctomycetes bacterium Pla163]|uniref:Putative ABC transporter ATP-binding protein YxlF n=1 Tax=Rohdeia mirabilis TaxID=2528008 RepID=A0A518D1R0_9BACT|nr:putative ABC transporter ATP-binding protein YxlF [Planctomycetes bacterium Pla163]
MIRVHRLSKSYGSFRAVQDVSFEIERGEVVGFLGPNGAGKSTTMKVLCGYLVADAGEVEVAGAKLPEQGPLARARVGYLPESTPLYRAMRVDRFLDFAARAKGLGRSERRAALARAVAAADLLGYLDRRIDQLSKGYRQRVGLAQALLADPDVLVLDEPTSGLDPNEVVRIRELIRELGRTKTVLLSTHVLGEVSELCPRVLILSGGRLVADGAPHALAAARTSALFVRFTASLGSARGSFDALEGAFDVSDVPVTNGAALRLRTDDPDGLATRVLDLVRERGLELVELRHEAPTLEQVFAAHTGGRDGRFDAVEAGGPV